MKEGSPARFRDHVKERTQRLFRPEKVRQETLGQLYAVITSQLADDTLTPVARGYTTPHILKELRFEDKALYIGKPVPADDRERQQLQHVYLESDGRFPHFPAGEHIEITPSRPGTYTAFVVDDTGNILTSQWVGGQIQLSTKGAREFLHFIKSATQAQQNKTTVPPCSL